MSYSILKRFHQRHVAWIAELIRSRSPCRTPSAFDISAAYIPAPELPYRDTQYIRGWPALVKNLSEFIPKKSSFLSCSWPKARPTSLDLANSSRYPLLFTPKYTSLLSSTDLSTSKLLNNGSGHLASIYRQGFKLIA